MRGKREGGDAFDKDINVDKGGKRVKDRGKCGADVISVRAKTGGYGEARDGVPDERVEGKCKQGAGGGATLADTAAEINNVLVRAEKTNDAKRRRVKEAEKVDYTWWDGHVPEDVKYPLMGEGRESRDKIGEKYGGAREAVNKIKYSF